MNRLACRVMVAVAGMAVLGMTATLAGAQTHPATYTLNDVMQAPFASDMLAAPTGAAVAWVFNAKGCSNIWVADPSHGAKARQITPYTEADSFDIGELAWSPDVKSIAFTRGQSLEDTPSMRTISITLIFLSAAVSSASSFPSTVRFDFIDNTSLIVVPVNINGHGPYRFLLDTGANNTLLSTGIADTLKIARGRRGTLVTAGGSVDVTVRVLSKLKVGTAQLENIEIAVGDFDLMKTLKVDGVLGSDYLRRFNVAIDYDSKVVDIAP